MGSYAKQRGKLEQRDSGIYGECSQNISKSVRMGEGRESRHVLGDKFCSVQIVLDFEFQIKESGFMLYSLEAPTDSVLQKANSDYGVDEEEEDKRLVRNQERHSKG